MRSIKIIIYILLIVLSSCNISNEVENKVNIQLNIPRAPLDITSIALIVEADDISTIRKSVSNTNSISLDVPVGNNRTFSIIVTLENGSTLSGSKTQDITSGTSVVEITLASDPIQVTGETFTVTYDIGDGTGTLPVDDSNYVEGADVILNDGIGLTLIGSYFAGWAIESGGDIISSLYTMTSSDVIFYALWNIIGTGVDSYELDNSPAEADLYNRSIVVGEVQYHNIHEAEEQDWMTFDAIAGIEYTFFTSDAGNDKGGDTYLYLYHGDNVYDVDARTELAKNDDGGPGLYSVITYIFEMTGTYYLMINDFSSGASNVDYYVSVSQGEALQQY